VVDVVSSKEMVTALRIGLIFSNLLDSIDADALHAVVAGAGKETLSLLALGKQAALRDARRGLATAVGLLNPFWRCPEQAANRKVAFDVSLRNRRWENHLHRRGRRPRIVRSRSNRPRQDQSRN
jgi:hypothetical protein